MTLETVNALLHAAGASHRLAFQSEAGGLVAVRVQEHDAAAMRARDDSGDDGPRTS